tara:strand:+ start:223 stop:360 length:138 start_codon:yes stop_codon:yes gene_type:complete
MVQTMKKNNEINKNMFSLHFKQKQKMKEEHAAHEMKLEELKEQVI